MMYFVTGASGFLGTHLVRLLVEDGHDVAALVYEPDREATVRALGADTVVGGFDPNLLQQAMAGCDGVFHVAGFVSLSNRTRDISRKVNVEGVRIVLDAATKANVKRLVHTSSLVAIGGNLAGVELNEDSKWEIGNLGSAYVDTKRAGEQLALQQNGNGLEVIVCNAAGMLGPADDWGSAANVIFDMYLRNGIRAVPHVRNNWVDVRDVARGHIQAMQLGRPGERYFLGQINTTLDGLLQRLDTVAGRAPIPRRVIHWPWTYLIGSVLQVFNRDPPLSAASARFMRYAFWVSNMKAKRELGYDPRPIEDTLRDSLDWFRDGRHGDPVEPSVTEG